MHRELLRPERFLFNLHLYVALIAGVFIVILGVTGSIMAFQVTGDGANPSLIPQWTTPNMVVPDPPVAANGVLYALHTGEQTIQNPVLPPGTPRNTPAQAAKFRATPVSNLIFLGRGRAGRPRQPRPSPFSAAHDALRQSAGNLHIPEHNW